MDMMEHAAAIDAAIAGVVKGGFPHCNKRAQAALVEYVNYSGQDAHGDKPTLTGVLETDRANYIKFAKDKLAPLVGDQKAIAAAVAEGEKILKTQESGKGGRP